jgi:hypothetical protein
VDGVLRSGCSGALGSSSILSRDDDDDESEKDGLFGVEKSRVVAVLVAVCNR